MNTTVGQLERITQDRVVNYFRTTLGYVYLGNFQDRENNRNIESHLLTKWLKDRAVSDKLITRALHELSKVSALGEGRNLYDANRDTYTSLRYGIKVSEDAGENDQTVYLIDWKQPEKNHFAIAEEVTIKGENKKRPDVVLYVNGIALVVLELKRSSVSVGEGISQNLDNQKKDFIRNFFSTIQLVMAGNDSAGLRYGTIQTPASHYYQWKLNEGEQYDNLLDHQLGQICEKSRLLELIHDYTVFDAGIKKIPRHNQYYGVKAAQYYLKRREGGIIWHTQGSGKSLTMVWLAKWLRENVTDARVVVITDRTELDQQIEEVFLGVDEQIYRSKSGADLVGRLNETTPWLLCSLVHKFGRSGEATEKDTEEYLEDIQINLPTNFKVKGNCFVFVDECHRTQSGSLHDAMKSILPDAVFIGFTGTPLLKADKQKSLEVFGSYIHTYKFDEAVADGVVLDLRYEARDIEQYVTNQTKVDQWFESKTAALSDFARVQLKKKWGSMQKLMSSQSRLDQIVKDILFDMETKQRLNSGRGNAMLVCGSVHQACKVYEQFQSTELAGKCAIITSYKPSPSDIKGEETGEGLTEALSKYSIYRSMLSNYFEVEEERAMYQVEQFEKQVKDRFKNQPGQMRLLIVVDKLLTGFDAPSATYLYIDKKMQDHGLFQAICRVNRLDGEDKDYGYIVDYKDLFKSLEGAVDDYTSEAFDGYDADDVKGLLTDRIEKARDKLDEMLEVVKALCEPVMEPRGDQEYIRYFCGDVANKDDLAASEQKRVNLYKNVGALIRAYVDIAAEMTEAGYSSNDADGIKRDVDTYSKVRDVVKVASGDHIDMKHYEPGMRKLLDMFVGARDSQSLVKFDDIGVIEMLVNQGSAGVNDLAKALGGNREAVAETIENNVRKVIIDEQAVNPKYYEKMSELLDALIQQRREEVLDYQEYLEQIKSLATQVSDPTGVRSEGYPTSLDTGAKKALYDNLEQDENLVIRLDTVVRHTKESHWVGDRFKERKIKRALERELGDASTVDIDALMSLIKNQHDYH